MPLIDELLDAIRTGDVNVRDYILILHPEHYSTLRASLQSAAARDGMEDPRFFGFEIRVDASLPREQVAIIRREPPRIITRQPFELDELLRQDTVLMGNYEAPQYVPPSFIGSLTPEQLWTHYAVTPRSSPAPEPKTLWDHLEADWDE